MRTIIPPYDAIRSHFFNDGMSMREIAKKYGTAHTAIYRNAAKGAKQREHEWPFVRQPWPNYHRLKGEYLLGATWEELATKYSCNVHGLHDHMRRTARKIGDPWPFRKRISQGGADLITTVGIAAEINEFREKYRVTYKDLAEAAGVSPSYLSRVAGRRRNGSGELVKDPKMDRAKATQILEGMDKIRPKLMAANALNARRERIKQRKAA